MTALEKIDLSQRLVGAVGDYLSNPTSTVEPTLLCLREPAARIECKLMQVVS